MTGQAAGLASARRRAARAAVCVGLVLASVTVAAAPAQGQAVRGRQIQAELDAVVRAGVPGVVFLVRDGHEVHVFTSGRADVTRHRRISAGDRFRIASISKTFVAATVLRLVAEHRLGLDDLVDRWVPGLLRDPAITVRQLLQHTSGLFDYPDDPDWFAAAQADPLRRWQPAELLAVAAAHPPYFAPGRSFHYSSTGYVALGLVLRAATGRTPAALVEDQLIRPLRLRSTYVAEDPSIDGRHAHGYTDDGSGPVDVTAMDPSLAWVSGDVISTVTDVERFYRQLLAGRLLAPDLLAAMESFVATGDGPGFGSGLGLFRVPQQCGVTVGHTGGIFGFSSDAEETLDQRHQLVVFANTDSIPQAGYRHFARATQLALCGS